MEPDARLMDHDQHNAEEGDQREQKVHHRGKYVGDREDLVHEAGLGKKIVASDHTRESRGGGIAQHPEYEITGKDINRIEDPVHQTSVEEQGKDQSNDHHVQERVQYRPKNAQYRVAILIADVPVHHGNESVYRTLEFLLFINLFNVFFLHSYPCSVCEGALARNKSLIYKTISHR